MRDWSDARGLPGNRQWRIDVAVSVLLVAGFAIVLGVSGVTSVAGDATSGAGGPSAVAAQSGSCDVDVADGEPIQDAVDAAGTGDTVCLADGTYEQNVTIDVEGLTLGAADGATPVLNGTETLETAVRVDGVDDVVVEGVEATDFENTTVLVRNAANATVRDARIRYSSGTTDGFGLHVVDSPEITVSDVEVTDHDQGVLFRRSDGASLADSVVTDNTGSTFDADGLYVQSSDGVAVRNNVLDDNGNSGVEVVEQSADAVVENNSIDGNSDYGILVSKSGDATLLDNSANDAETGIYLYGAREAVARNNTANESHEQGIHVANSPNYASDNASVVDNVATGNRDEGIRVEVASDVTLAGNVVTENGHDGSEDAGVRLKNADDVVLADNVVSDNDVWGIYLDGEYDGSNDYGPNRNPIVENNTVSGHDLDLDVYRSPNATVHGNDLGSGVALDGDEFAHFDHDFADNTAGGEPVFFANGADDPAVPADAGQVIVVDSTNVEVTGHDFDGVTIGVQIAYSDGATVDGNTFSAMEGSDELTNDRGAIAVRGGADVTVSGNTVSDSDWASLSVHDAVDAAIVDNVMENHSLAGTFIVNSTGTEITENEVRDGADYEGIHLSEGSDDAAVEDNVVEGHEAEGVYVEESDGATIRDNLASENDRGISYDTVEDVFVANNTAVDNEYTGVGSRGASHANENVTIAANEVKRNAPGIRTSGDAVEVVVRDNVVADNTAEGIDAGAGLITNNTVTGNAEYGIDASGSSVVDGNDVTANGEHGIFAYDGAVSNNTVADNGQAGIRLDSWEDGPVANNTVSGHAVDLQAVESTNATVVDNEFETGVSIDGDDGLYALEHAFADNTVGGDPLVYVREEDDPDVGADAGQVIVVNSTNVEVSGIDAADVATPLQISYSEHVEVVDVSVSNAVGHGLLVDTVAPIEIRQSVFESNAGHGLAVELANVPERSTVANNTIVDNQDGVHFAQFTDVYNVSLLDNRISDNARGIAIQDDAVNVRIGGNSFDGNDLGLLYDHHSPTDLNATDNWWGDASGPSGGATDACTGATADGNGDAIDDASEDSVCFEPWLDAAPFDGPSASFGVDPAAPLEGETVTFDASGSTAPEGIDEYRWDLTGDGTVDETTTGPTVTHTYADAGSYEVELEVADPNGVTDDANATVDVIEAVPLEAVVELDPVAPAPGETVTFDAANSTTPADAIDEYRWDLTGDGGVDETTTDPTVSHTYSDAGSYEVELEIEDDRGETNVTTATVHVAEDGTTVWSHETDERIGASSPTVVDGTAYVDDYNGTLSAVDVATGDTEWTFHHDTYRDEDSPTVVDGVVYLASQSAVADGTLHAVDADSGDELWNASLGRAPSGSTVYGDAVYVTTGSDSGHTNGYVLAYDADGERRWSYETDTPTTSAPTVTDDTVYVGDDSGTLYALGADDGIEEWTWEGETTIPAAPTVADGTVYVPTNAVDPEFGGGVPAYSGYLYALDAANGDEVWDQPFADGETVRGITAAPTVRDDVVYLAGGDDEVFAVDAADGTELWTFGTHAPVRSSPTVAAAPGGVDGSIDEALVFVGNDDGNVYSIGATTGTARWIVDAGRWVRSSPTVADGVVYVGADYFDPGDPDTAVGDGEQAGDLYAVDAGVDTSSDDSRVELATLGHNELLQPHLDVEVISTNAPVMEGETLTVEAAVTNTGRETTGTVELEDFDGTVVDDADVTVARGETETLTVEMDTAAGDADAGDVVVRSADDADAETVGIQQETEFSGCRVIDTPGVYTLTGGQTSSSTCVEITASHVEIEGNHNLLMGRGLDDGAHGIHVNGSEGRLTDVAVRNVTLNGWATFEVDNAGIRLENVTDSEVSGVTVDESYYGVWASNVSDSTFTGNDLTGNTWWGGYFVESPGNEIVDSEFAGAYYGLQVSAGSNDTVVADSVVAANNYGLLVTGSAGTDVVDVDARYNRGDRAAPWDLADLYASDAGPVSVENYTLSAPAAITVRTVSGDETADGTVHASDEADLAVDVAPNPDVRLSVEALNVDLEATTAPAPNPDAHALGQYVAVAEEAGESSYLDLAVHYEEAHLDGAAESALSLWRYDESADEWTDLGATVDADGDVVSANITTYGTVGVFVDDPGSATPAAPPTDDVSTVTVAARENGSDTATLHEFDAVHRGGIEWNATVDVSGLTDGVIYDLEIVSVDEYDGQQSVTVDETLAVGDADQEADLAVTDASVSDTDVETGEAVTVTATVENDGDAAGDRTLELSVDGSVEMSGTVTVDSGATEQVTFTHSFDDAGEYDLAVDGVDAGSVTVEADDGSAPDPDPDPDPEPEPDVSVTDVTLAESELAVGDQVSVTVTLENVGDAGGTETVELTVDGVVVDTATVDVPSLGSTAHTLSASVAEAGTLDVAVTGAQFDVTVEPAVSVSDAGDGASVSVTGAQGGESAAIPLGDAVGDDAAADLTGLNVTLAEDGDFDATVDATDEPPADAGDLPAGSDAMLYVDVAHGLDDENIEGATFEFSVPTDELADRGLAPDEVTLYHLVDGQWTERESTVVANDGDTVDLRVDVPHFSWFSLAGQRATPEVTETSLAASELTAGESTAVEATVRNDGGAAGEATVSLRVDGDAVETRTVTVAAGADETVEFTREFASTGEYGVAVDDVGAGTVTVLEPAAFEVSDPSASPDEVAVGETVTLSATATNVGDASGTHAVTFEVGDVTETREVELDGGESTAVEFSHEIAAAGDYDLRVDGNVVGDVTVSDAQADGPTATSTDTDGDDGTATPTSGPPTETTTDPADDESDDGGSSDLAPLVGALVAIAAILAAGVLFLRRLRQG